MHGLLFIKSRQFALLLLMQMYVVHSYRMEGYECADVRECVISSQYIKQLKFQPQTISTLLFSLILSLVYHAYCLFHQMMNAIKEIWKRSRPTVGWLVRIAHSDCYSIDCLLYIWWFVLVYYGIKSWINYKWLSCGSAAPHPRLRWKWRRWCCWCCVVLPLLDWR